MILAQMLQSERMERLLSRNEPKFDGACKSSGRNVSTAWERVEIKWSLILYCLADARLHNVQQSVSGTSGDPMETAKTRTGAVLTSPEETAQSEPNSAKTVGDTRGSAGKVFVNAELSRRSLQSLNMERRIEEAVKQENSRANKKDIWDKLTALSPIISGFLIFVTGSYCTYTYNQQQIRIQQCQTIEKFIPHLMGNEQSKKAAILALSTLINYETASKFASIFASTGTVSALQSLSQNGTDKDKLIASQALAAALQNLAQRANQLSAMQADYTKAMHENGSEAAPDKDLPETPASLNNLAQDYIAKGQYALAEPLLKKALTIRGQASGPEHQEILDSLKALAELSQLNGRGSASDAAVKKTHSNENRPTLPEPEGATVAAEKLPKASSNLPDEAQSSTADEVTSDPSRKSQN